LCEEISRTNFDLKGGGKGEKTKRKNLRKIKSDDALVASIREIRCQGSARPKNNQNVRQCRVKSRWDGEMGRKGIFSPDFRKSMRKQQGREIVF